MHILRGLRAAALMLTTAVAVAVLAGALWVAVQGGDLRSRTGVVCLCLAGLISLTGGTALTRAGTNDARAFLGAGPDREEPSAGQHLTGVGVFLFVSVPLFLLGGLLLPVP